MSVLFFAVCCGLNSKHGYIEKKRRRGRERLKKHETEYIFLMREEEKGNNTL